MSFQSQSRRRFLTVLATGTASMAAGCGGSGADQPTGPIAAGNVKNLPVNTLRAVDGEAVAIGRDDGGVYAMTLVCTHAGCDMSSQGSVSFQGVTCNCHGSRFSATGSVTQGPANAPLDHFRVDVDSAGEMTIQADAVVDASARTAVAV